MKLPRDISGIELSKSLRKFNYKIVRQTGSHIRLTTDLNGEHHITIPAHNPIKPGTLNSILVDIASHLQISKNDFINSLFY